MTIPSQSLARGAVAVRCLSPHRVWVQPAVPMRCLCPHRVGCLVQDCRVHFAITAFDAWCSVVALLCLHRVWCVLQWWCLVYALQEFGCSLQFCFVAFVLTELGAWCSIVALTMPSQRSVFGAMLLHRLYPHIPDCVCRCSSGALPLLSQNAFSRT